MQLLYRSERCPLCGEVHPLVIHSYPSRSYRDPESQEDVWIKIPVRYCGLAKALGRQYTERLLPDFLIPFTRMRLEAVIEAVRSKESGGSLEQCCRMLGYIDLRTARMHLRRLEEAVKTAALTLAERQAAANASKRIYLLPSCSQRKTLLFAEYIYEEILRHLQHSQIVFNIPDSPAGVLPSRQKAFRRTIKDDIRHDKPFLPRNCR